MSNTTVSAPLLPLEGEPHRAAGLTLDLERSIGLATLTRRGALSGALFSVCDQHHQTGLCEKARFLGHHRNASQIGNARPVWHLGSNSVSDL